MTQPGRPSLALFLVFLILLEGTPVSAGSDPAAGAAAGGRDEVGVPARSPTSATAPARTTAPADITTSINEARGLIKNGNYDAAIETLRGVLQSERERLAANRDVYLLLIEAHVQQGNYFRFRDQGHTPSELNYQEARRLIAECLKTKELRHVRPEPASEYAEETIRFFADVRNELFGSFRVAKLDPSSAVVLLDADTLRAQPPDLMIGDVDIPVGPHLVVVRAPSHKAVTEEVIISANSTLERSYDLKRKHGKAWYTAVGAGALALVGGTIAIIGGGNQGTTAATEEPLPTAPNPPKN